MNVIDTSVRNLSLGWLIMVRQSEFHFAVTVSSLSFSPLHKEMPLLSDCLVEEGCLGFFFF